VANHLMIKYRVAMAVIDRGWQTLGDMAGSAGINRHVVGDARALQERRERIHPDPESCGDRCEAIVEA
jgi:hypothetical protein